MKIKVLAATLALTTALLAGCSKPASKPAGNGTATTPAPTKAADVTTTASVVDNGDAFEKAIAKDGKWIIATTKDLTINKDLVVDGTFKNGKKNTDGTDAIQRKIGLYTQDDKHKVTARFTLTAPKITFNSPSGSIEHGTFKGDLYIAGKDFKLVNATIVGNIYFLNEDAQKTFSIKDVDPSLDSVKTTISGTQTLKK